MSKGSPTGSYSKKSAWWKATSTPRSAANARPRSMATVLRSTAVTSWPRAASQTALRPLATRGIKNPTGRERAYGFHNKNIRFKAVA